MTKSPRKLVLHKETLRALTSMELRRAIGGADGNNQVDNTFNKNCPAVNMIVAPGQ
ncbi:MAG TPA: hypothetical protein VF516_21555 [Kofleriaceae bacterium]